MKHWAGFDGGGTKTDCVILTDGGEIAGMGHAGPANALRCGFETAFRSIAEAASEALESAHLKPGDIAGVCAGLAGAGQRSVVRRMMVFLGNEFPHATVNVTTDLEVALELAVGPGPGVVLIAGTGSAAYGRNATGETARSGGYGPWVGDEGSAYDIGRRAVAAVARARDLNGPVTLLAEMISSVLNCSEWDDLMQRIAARPDEILPKLFPAVTDAANSGDSTAMEILFTAAVGLGNLALTVARRLEMNEGEFTLAKCGGVFGRSPQFDELLDSILASSAPQAKILHLKDMPALGAARMAARLGESAERTQTHGA